MTTESQTHRLTGLEPDNLLAFLALLGLMRALGAADGPGDALQPRAAWDLSAGPVRPVLHVGRPVTAEEVVEAVASGLDTLARDYDFDGRPDLDYTADASRALLHESACSASIQDRARADLLSALMSDAALKDGSTASARKVDPTPFCLLFGQGHQHFLARLADVPKQAAPPPRGLRKDAVQASREECLAEALFAPWRREDPTFAFRWDPDEDVRYALMAGDPTDDAYKARTQHGANRLAALGLAVLTVVPQARRGRVRPTVLGGQSDRRGFAFAWPVWRGPTSLAAIRGLLGHPGLWRPDGLRHLGVEYVYVTQRISVGKFMNFTRARVLGESERIVAH